MVLPGEARPIRVCRRLRLRSPAPAGTDPDSLACGTSHRREEPLDEARKASSLRDLYTRVDRTGAQAGLQLARCPIRCLAGVHSQPSPCGLDPAESQI